MNATEANIDLYAGKKLHGYFNPTTWNDFCNIVKKLKYADKVNVKAHIGIIQLMELADFIKSVIELEVDSVEFIILNDMSDPALLYERFDWHVKGEIECAKLLIKNFINLRFQNFNQTKLLSTYNKKNWTDIEYIINFLDKLQKYCEQPVVGSDTKWNKFTESLVNNLDNQNINEYITSFKLVGGEIFSNV